MSAEQNGEFDLTNYPTEFLACREQMRHTLPLNAEWRWSILRSTTGRVIEYSRTTQCRSCQAIVQDTINPANGTRARKITRPTLPVVYRIPRAAEVSIYAIRQELVRRFEEQATVYIVKEES
jgi:hypothetical protein